MRIDIVDGVRYVSGNYPYISGSCPFRLWHVYFQRRHQAYSKAEIALKPQRQLKGHHVSKQRALRYGNYWCHDGCEK